MGALTKNFRLAAVMIMAVTACESEPGPSPASSSQGARPWLDDTKPAAAEGKVGGADTACKLPVQFDTAAKWKAKQVTSAEEGGSLTNQGTFTMVCEIDAKPAGNLGFLRVWTSRTTGQARAALDRFLADDRNITVPEIREVKVAGATAAEVTYVRDNPTAEVKKRERVLVVPTPDGAALLHLGGLDDEEHDQMLPAYVLAKQTMKI
ncbi:hypothetical protein JOF56_005540 [Kibdelosporangium banguiense]|uniref:DUF3558 domain-containing protein n=1 Tax=Kibdelosporangium banguiense TaxID=1365924 RepID=A0ABS4TL85_9PSEU|nr:lipoprotein [Kibdelosporangium banguiense]MBP2325155.1 hypothetical protein [Kibdelosporangium banguiense]